METNGQLCCARDSLSGSAVCMGFVEGEGHLVVTFHLGQVAKSLRGRGKAVVETRI